MRLAIRILITLLISCAYVGCGGIPSAKIGAQPPAKNAPLQHPPLSKFVTNVFTAFFVERLQQRGGEHNPDTTIYILANGLRPNEVPANLDHTKFQYIKTDQIDKLAAKAATDVRPFVYFRLGPGAPTSEGWRTLYISPGAVLKTPTGLFHSSGLGSSGYAEVPIQGEFRAVNFSHIIVD